MRETDDGEIMMTRREYEQLMAAVPASHAASDDGWFSGLFGSSDDEPDGPGLFEDFEVRHGEEHIITDPETIEFIGEALDVEQPNKYDHGVRIRVDGDVAVKGKDINPASIGKDDPAESVHVERAAITSGYTLEVNPAMQADDGGSENGKTMRDFFNQYVSTNQARGIGLELFVDNMSDQRLFVQEGKNLREIGFWGSSGILEAGAYWRGGELLVMDSDTAYFYDSEADFTSDTRGASMTSIHPPHGNTGILTFRNTNQGYAEWIWGEYTTADEPNTVRIIKANAAGFTTVLSVSDVRHFHSVDQDPYNEATFYATTGDTDAGSKVYKSTDWGENWSEIAGGDMKFRTLNQVFTEAAMYWVTDVGDPTRPSELVKTTNRSFSSTSDLEVLKTFEDADVGYGVCRFFDPPGLLTLLKPAPSADKETGELWFYDFENDEHLLMREFSPPQAVRLSEYQNPRTGTAYMRRQNNDKMFPWDDLENRPHVVEELGIKKFQIGTG